MLKEYLTFFRRVVILADILTVCAGFLTAYYVRNYISSIDTVYFYLRFLPLVVSIWIIYLYIFGLYKSFRTEGIPMSLFIVFNSTCLGYMTFGFFLHALKVPDFSRSLAILIFIIVGAFLVIKKVCQIYFFRSVRGKGYNYKNILMVGSGRRSQQLAKQIESHSELGFKIIGFIDKDKEKVGQSVGGYSIIGSCEDIPDIVNTKIVDEVIFAVPPSLFS